MGSLFWKVVMALMLPLIVIGLVRMAIGARPEQFLPSYEALFTRFATMPDFMSDLRNAVTTFNTKVLDMEYSFSNITDLPAFFQAFGSFFEMVGNLFVVIFQCLAIPFKFAYWFLTFLFDVSDLREAANNPVVLANG